MALSVLTIPPATKGEPKSCGIWDSETKDWILQGASEDMFSVKHDIESAEQEILNNQHNLEVKQDHIDRLVKAGLSTEWATELVDRYFAQMV